MLIFSHTTQSTLRILGFLLALPSFGFNKENPGMVCVRMCYASANGVERATTTAVRIHSSVSDANDAVLLYPCSSTSAAGAGTSILASGTGAGGDTATAVSIRFSRSRSAVFFRRSLSLDVAAVLTTAGWDRSYARECFGTSLSESATEYTLPPTTLTVGCSHVLQDTICVLPGW